MPLRRIGAVCAVSWLLGCAASGGAPRDAGEPSSSAAEAPPSPERAGAGGFPTPETLENLRSQPQTPGLLRRKQYGAERWELVGPFPERVAIEPWTQDSPVGRLLAESVARRPGLVVPTRAMHCVAREIGRFFLRHGASPPDGLQRRVRGLCRASSVRLQYGWLQGEVAPEASDAELVEAWRDGIEETLRARLMGGPHTAGAWLGRDGSRALLFVVAGDRQLQLDAVTGPEADGRVVIEGEALGPVREMRALVTRGALGFEPCRNDPELPLPRFRLTCRIDPRDRSAWLALSLYRQDRILGELGAELLLWPGGAVDPAYRRPAYVASRQVWDADTAAVGFVELLNQVRESQQLEPLRLEPRQSETARELAPHFFAARSDRIARSVADVIVLGMMAGWSIDGIVQSAHFTAAALYDSNDVGRLLSEALDQPVSRAALLADDAERIAVGPVLEVSDGRASMGVVVGTYALFSAEDHAESARRVFERLGQARAERRLPAPQRLEELQGLSTLAAAAVQSGAEPQEALREMLDASGRALRRSVRGWTVETGALEDLEFPQELLTEEHVGVSVGVSSYRPEGEAWGRYVVMIVSAEPGRGI